ncbi:MAG: M28 family peptidase [Candidatus Hadarchaeum sp.]|uniref:M28 family metallopeptidase n=1 Tax=Candidatus Hadarchaeum sp. TaxID=2883567 RepID=UPI003D0F94DF
MAEFESRSAFEHIDKLAYEIGPRLAGSRGDRQAADYIRKQFENLGLKVRIQEFKFVGHTLRTKVAAALLALAFLLTLFLSPEFSLLSWLAALVLWRYLEKLLPKRVSQNIIAVKEVEAPKKRVALTAHYDSAPCTISFRLSLLVRFTFLPLVLVVTASLLLRVAGMIPDWPLVWAVLAIFFLPVCGASFIAAGGRRVSPGAEDNASGVAVMLESARVLTEQPLPETTMFFIAFGAEEQGLIGSKRLAREKLIPKDTLVLNLDMVGASNQPYVIEGNGIIRRVRTSEALNQKLLVAISNLGLKPKLWWAALAGHDHIPLLRAGIQATTFTFDAVGVDKLGQRIARFFRLPNARIRGYRYLHSYYDLPDHVNVETIERAGAVVAEFLKMI